MPSGLKPRVVFCGKCSRAENDPLHDRYPDGTYCWPRHAFEKYPPEPTKTVTVGKWDNALMELAADTFGLAFDERLAVLRERLEPLLEGAEKCLAAPTDEWLDAAEEFEKELSKWKI